MTGRTLEIELAIPPSINAAWCNVPGKGRVHTAQYRAWRKQALASIEAQAHGVTFRGTFRIAVLASDQGLIRDRDCDNLGKAIADTLTKAGKIADDCYRHMRAISIEWSPDLSAGTCRVAIEELSAEPLPKPGKAPRRPAKQVPASIMAALRKRGINVAPEKVHL